MSHSSVATPLLEEPSAGHESPEVDLPRTIVAAAAIAVMIFASVIVSHWVFYDLLQPIGERTLTPLGGEGLVLPPSPQLEGIEMMSGLPSNQVQVDATRQLQAYGWVDRDKGVIRVPIDRAMQIAIERKWLPSAPATPQKTGSDASGGASAENR